MTFTGDFKKTSNVTNRFVAYGADMEWSGGRVTKKILVGGARGVNKALEYLKALAVPLTPLGVTGNLRGSANVRQAVPKKPEGALIFDVPYAAVQHEELDYHHDEGQAKYVEAPMTAHQRNLNGIIAKEIADEINAE